MSRVRPVSRVCDSYCLRRIIRAEQSELESKSLPLLEINCKAQQIIDRQRDFDLDKELFRKTEEAAHAREQNRTLLAQLLRLLGPLFMLLNTLVRSSPLSLLAGMALATIVAVLPGTQYALQKETEAQENEKKVMEAENWAIERLNENLHETLHASHMLQRAISFHEFETQDDNSILQLDHACCLQSALRQQIKSIVNSLHTRQKSYNRAEYVYNRIQEVREETEGMDKQDFWHTRAIELKRERERQEIDQDDSEGICGNCVMM